jgi:hypothetical protein
MLAMTKAANARLVPVGLLLMAGVLLIVLLMRAQVGLAPAHSMHQIMGAGAAAAPAAQTNANSAIVSEQTITAIGSSAPLSAPKSATQQPVIENPAAPGSAKCPTSGSGLPCSIP